MSKVSEADHSAGILVPEREPGAFEAIEQRQAVDLPHLRYLRQTFLQSVVRNLAAEVVDMVDADVRGQPLQCLR